MEEVKDKTKVEKLEELLGKIAIEMDRTRERQTSIDNMTEELYNETRPMMVEKRKEELEAAKNEKAEFDEMTKNALINAKKQVLQIREESEKEYSEKLVETLRRKQDIDRKLSSMLVSMAEKRLPAEKLEKAKRAASEATEKVDKSMIEFQNKHFKLREELKEHEKTIWNNALELGFEQEIEAVTLEDVKVEDKTERTGAEDEGEKGPVKTAKNEGPQLGTSKPQVKRGPKVKATSTPTNADQTKSKAAPSKAGAPKTATAKVAPKTATTELKWHKDLTPEQIEYAKERDIYEPVGLEYEQFLRELGIVPEKAKVENTTATPVKNGATELKWHKDLTPEQIEYAKEKDIYEPVGPEYEQFLRELGLTVEPAEKVTPENTTPENTTPENTSNEGQENKKESTILVVPVKNQIEYSLADITDEVVEGQYEEIKYDSKTIEQIKGVLKNFGPELDWEKVSAALDPNIIDLMAKAGGSKADDMLTQYFEALSGKKTDLSIGYDLRNIYDSNLDSKQIKKLMKIAKSASKLSKGAIKVEKDSLLKRIAGSIKKKFQEIDKKLLEEDNRKKESAKKSETTKAKPEASKEKESKAKETKSKTKVIDKLKARLPKRETTTKTEKRPNIISKAKSIAASTGRELSQGLQIAGARLTGYFSGERKEVTDMKVNNIRASFVPRAIVDEAKAVEAAEKGASAAKEPRKVVIEHPDGRKEEGVSLMDEEVK